MTVNRAKLSPEGNPRVVEVLHGCRPGDWRVQGRWVFVGWLGVLHADLLLVYFGKGAGMTASFQAWRWEACFLTFLDC